MTDNEQLPPGKAGIDGEPDILPSGGAGNTQPEDISKPLPQGQSGPTPRPPVSDHE